MPSGRSNRSLKRLLDVMTGTAVAPVLKAMLVDDSYVHSNDRNFVDDGTADDPLSHEIAVTGYTGGFGGSGRKSLTSKTSTQDDANDRATFDAADIVWSSLGAGATIGGTVLIEEVTDDTDSVVWDFIELATPITTNGSDFTLQWNSAGIKRLS